MGACSNHHEWKLAHIYIGHINYGTYCAKGAKSRWLSFLTYFNINNCNSKGKCISNIIIGWLDSWKGKGEREVISIDRKKETKKKRKLKEYIIPFISSVYKGVTDVKKKGMCSFMSFVDLLKIWEYVCNIPYLGITIWSPCFFPLT